MYNEVCIYKIMLYFALDQSHYESQFVEREGKELMRELVKVNIMKGILAIIILTRNVQKERERERH